MKDYRGYLKAIGRTPIKGPLRTSKQPGHLEIVWCPKAKDWIEYRHGEEAEAA